MTISELITELEAVSERLGKFTTDSAWVDDNDRAFEPPPEFTSEMQNTLDVAEQYVDEVLSDLEKAEPRHLRKERQNVAKLKFQREISELNQQLESLLAERGIDIDKLVDDFKERLNQYRERNDEPQTDDDESETEDD